MDSDLSMLTSDDHRILKLSLQICKTACDQVLIPCIFYGTHASKPWSVFVPGLKDYPKPEDLDEIDNLVWTEGLEHAIDDAGKCRRTVCYRSQTYTLFFSDQVRCGCCFISLPPDPLFGFPGWLFA